MKNVSSTATGAVGNLAKTGKTTAGAIGQGDVKGAGAGFVKGAGATIGGVGKGVCVSFLGGSFRMLILTDRSERLCLVLGKGWIRLCKLAFHVELMWLSRGDEPRYFHR